MATKSAKSTPKLATPQEEHWEVHYTDAAEHERYQNLFNADDAQAAANSHAADGFTEIAIDKVVVTREPVEVKLVEPEPEEAEPVNDEVS